MNKTTRPKRPTVHEFALMQHELQAARDGLARYCQHASATALTGFRDGEPASWVCEFCGYTWPDDARTT